MRIGICTAQVPFMKGGAENLTSELYNELLKRGYEVEYISIPFKWYPPKEIIKHGLVWRLLDLTESNGEKIDLLICTRFPSYIVKHPNKVAWLIHQFREAYDLFDTPYGLKEYGKEGEEIRKNIIKFDNNTLIECKKIYTISNNVSSRLEKFNGINSKTIYPPPKNLDKFYCGNFDDYFVYPSRIDIKKRQSLLIEAMRYTRSAARIVIVGTGPRENELKTLAKKLKVSEKVKFHGYATDEELINLYANSLGVVFIPIDEDYGYITLEAFLSQKPVITARDAGGPLEFVEESKNGYILKPDPEEIAGKIDYLFENKNIAKKMGLHGYNKVKNMNITWDNVIKQLVG